jgi:hypothetical protein
MGLKFYFNQKAWEALAKELRRASWGISVIFSAGGYKLDNALVLLSGGVFWAILQITALVLESIKDERNH